MKKIISLLVAATVLSFAACTDENSVVENQFNSEISEANSVSQSDSSSVVFKAVAASTPSISSVTGSYGRSIPNTHPLYDSYLLATYSNGSEVRIKGINLGSTKGTVVLEKLNGSSWGSTSSYSTSIVSWSSTEIVIKLYSNLNSEPITSARFKVTLANSQISTSKTISIVNSTLGRLYGECTYHAITRTLQNGLSGWSGAYTNANAKTITATYVPTANDVLIWGSSHQAFIENVSTSKSGNLTTYVLKISERNVTGSTPGGGYSTAIVNYTATVKVNTLTKSFVSGYSTYRSTLKSGANKVRIQ